MNRSTRFHRILRPVSWLVFYSLLATSCTDHDLPGPHYDLDVTLRGIGKVSGFLKFRQFSDRPSTIFLDTSVQGLEPNTSYVLQRAVDTNLDGICSSSSWLTLGKDLAPQAILTDNLGNGSAALFRGVAAIPSGSTFDIHFQIVNEKTSAVALTSDCLQYTVR